MIRPVTPLHNRGIPDGIPLRTASPDGLELASPVLSDDVIPETMKLFLVDQFEPGRSIDPVSRRLRIGGP